ncbi:transcriptional regulator [Actinomadura sp. NBRC 104425]|uniref:transcriptional regulator n=1 Tax=Actinomadura sp. NBRC 104425 TaxID=3032204 RepID=UPI0025576C05|nr:transcriptional regulator [Actinomadura sp. NBRC 104425]
MSAEEKIIGARLREARESTPYWTRGEMARLLRDKATPEELPHIAHVNDLTDMIKQWETGNWIPRPRYRALYCRLLGKTEGELFGTRGDAPFSLDADLDLFAQGDLPARIDAIGGGRVGSGVVADLSARVHALRLADDVLAGGDLLAPAFRELRAAVRVHEEATYTEDVGRKVLALIGEFAQIAGWIAGDAGQYRRAADTYHLGIDAAREAGDGTLASYLIGSLAYQTSYIGGAGEALALAYEALDAAGPDAAPRARALAWDRVAWAAARAQDAQTATRALGEARAAFGEGGTAEGDPAYLYWLDAGELQIMEARAYTELRRPLRAVPLLVDVLGRYDTTHTRELALYLSWLAVALADANEPEQAAATASRMRELSADVASERTAERANVVLNRLKPFADVPAVRALLNNAQDA